MKENDDNQISIKVGEIVPPIDVFHSFLKFIYYDNVEFSVENSVYLLAFSDFYGLSNNKLQAHCLHIIETELNPKNLLQSYEASNVIQYEELKSTFLNEIIDNFVVVMEQKYVNQLSQPLLLEILKGLAARQKNKQ